MTCKGQHKAGRTGRDQPCVQLDFAAGGNSEVAMNYHQNVSHGYTQVVSRIRVFDGDHWKVTYDEWFSGQKHDQDKAKSEFQRIRNEIFAAAVDSPQ